LSSIIIHIRGFFWSIYSQKSDGEFSNAEILKCIPSAIESFVTIL